MSLARRLALLAWARRRDAWIIEDDYDSEYRYEGRPLASLQGLDADGRVLYIGTFSKVLCPGAARGIHGRAAGTGRRLRPCPGGCRPPERDDRAGGPAGFSLMDISRGTCAGRAGSIEERQAALVDAARRDLRGLLDIEPQAAGMHLVGWLPRGVDDRGGVGSRARGRRGRFCAVGLLRGTLPSGRASSSGYAGVDAEASKSSRSPREGQSDGSVSRSASASVLNPAARA